MRIRDFFKKREKEKEIKENSEIAKEKVGKPEVKAVAKATPLKAKKEVKGDRTSFRFLKFPHITEKASDLVEKNQYIFRVFNQSNKYEIKKSIEELYGVDVLKVRIINVPEKTRRRGKQIGYRGGYKKAIVRIKEGQKIEIMPR